MTHDRQKSAKTVSQQLKKIDHVSNLANLFTGILLHDWSVAFVCLNVQAQTLTLILLILQQVLDFHT